MALAIERVDQCVAAAGRLALPHMHEELLDLGVGELAWLAWAWLIEQTVRR